MCAEAVLLSPHLEQQQCIDKLSPASECRLLLLVAVDQQQYVLQDACVVLRGGLWLLGGGWALC